MTQPTVTVNNPPKGDSQPVDAPNPKAIEHPIPPGPGEVKSASNTTPQSLAQLAKAATPPAHNPAQQGPVPVVPGSSGITQQRAAPPIPAGLGKKTYYARYEGAQYHFSDGGTAVFTGGQYVFDTEHPHPDLTDEQWAQRYRELEYVVRSPQPIFSPEPVAITRSDAIVLREVGMAGGGVGVQGSVGNPLLGSR